jgi:hypothetical protein
LATSAPLANVAVMDFVKIEMALRQSPLFQELYEITESGDYSRFESRAKRQHFIPQFQLRQFGTPNDSDLIYQLAVNGGANRRVAVGQAASRRYARSARGSCRPRPCRRIVGSRLAGRSPSGSTRGLNQPSPPSPAGTERLSRA